MPWRDGDRSSTVTTGARVSSIPRVKTRARIVGTRVGTVAGSWAGASTVSVGAGGGVRATTVECADGNLGGDRDRGFV